MIIYQKCLKRLAIAQIVLTAIEILVVILIYAFLGRAASAEAHIASLLTSLPQYGIELFSGIVVLILYRKENSYNRFIYRLDSIKIPLLPSPSKGHLYRHTVVHHTAHPADDISDRNCGAEPSKHHRAEHINSR